MTDSTKPEELNDEALGAVTGGMGNIVDKTRERSGIIIEDKPALKGTDKGKLLKNPDRNFSSSASGSPNI